MSALLIGIPRDIATTRVSMGPATILSTTVHFDTDHYNGVVSIKVVPSKTLHTGVLPSITGSVIPVPSIISGRSHHGECRAEHSKGKCRTSTHCTPHTASTPSGSATSSGSARNTVDRTNVSTVTLNSTLSSRSSGTTAYEICKHSRCG